MTHLATLTQKIRFSGDTCYKSELKGTTSSGEIRFFMSAYLGASYRIVSKRINDFLVTNFLVFLVGYVSIVYEARLFMFNFKV